MQSPCLSFQATSACSLWDYNLLSPPYFAASTISAQPDEIVSFVSCYQNPYIGESVSQIPACPTSRRFCEKWVFRKPDPPQTRNSGLTHTATPLPAESGPRTRRDTASPERRSQSPRLPQSLHRLAGVQMAHNQSNKPRV